MSLETAFSLLYRWILPPALLSAVIFRINAVSLTYFVALLALGVLKRPAVHAGPRFLLAILVLVSSSSLIGQALFQISRATDYASDELQPCNKTEKIWRQIGLNQMGPFTHAERAQYIVPDLGILLLSIVTFFVARCTVAKVAARQDSTDKDVADGDGGPLTSFNRWVRETLLALGHLLFAVLLLTAGSAFPSALSMPYLVAFLTASILWGLQSRHKRLLWLLERAGVIYSAAHLLVLYLYQFQFFQEELDKESLAARVLGLNAIFITNCNHPWSLTLRSDIRWSEYLSLALIFALFWMCTMLSRHDRSSEDDADGHDRRKGDDFRREATIRASARTSRSDTGLIRPNTSPSPADTQATVVPATERRPDDTLESSFSVSDMPMVQTVVSFVEEYSYIVSLIVMMVWSIAYHSWLTFAFLTWACILWVAPDTQTWTKYCSPFLVIYAVSLIVMEYVFGLNLKDDELEGHDDTGLVKHKYPFPHLLLKSAFFWVFLLTLRYLTAGIAARSRTRTSGQDIPMRDVVAGGDADGVRPKASNSVKLHVYIDWVVSFLQSYWILVCYVTYLLVSLSGNVSIIKIGYMALFLVFFVTYQLSGWLWQVILSPLWWLAVFYSMTVLITIYTYQFDPVAESWNSTVDSTTWITDIGLERFSNDQLFVELLLPTVVLIAVILQIRYFYLLGDKEMVRAYKLEKATAKHAKRRQSKQVRGIVSTKQLSKSPDISAGDQRQIARMSTPSEGLQGLTPPLHHRNEIDADESHHIQSEPVIQPSSSASAAATANLIAGTAEGEGRSDVSVSWRDYLQWMWQRFIHLFYILLVLSWRLLELHLDKLIPLIILIVSLEDICFANAIAVFFVIMMAVFPSLRSICYLSFNIWALASILAKMGFQLQSISSTEDKSFRNCTPKLANQTYPDDVTWIGLRKSPHLPGYIQGYLWIMALIALRVVVRRHQTFVRRKHKEEVEEAQRNGTEGEVPSLPERGSVFVGPDRAGADKSIPNAAKYLVNHFFELFGIETTFVVCAIVVAVRLDVIAAIYAIFLGLLLIPRRLQGQFWSVFVFSIVILILVQYLLLLGTPPGLCYIQAHGYPWSDFRHSLLHFLYLTDPGLPQDKWFLVGDLFLLISASCQWRHFKTSNSPKQYHPPDFTSNETWLDFAKIVIFHHSLWLTLSLVFLSGTSRSSLLCLGYLLFTFFFLWYGFEQLQFDRERLHKKWKLLLVYTYIVITVTTCLQLWVCVWPDELPCSLSKLLQIVCQKPIEMPGVTTVVPSACQSSLDRTGLSLDVASFAFLLIQLRVFDSEYFLHVKHHLAAIFEHADEGVRLMSERQKARSLAQEMKESADLQVIEERVELLAKCPYKFQILYGGTILDDAVSFDEDVGSVYMTALELGRDEGDAVNGEEGESDEGAGQVDTDGKAKGDEKGECIGEPSVLQKIVFVLKDFVNKTVIDWLDEVSSDYLYVETQLGALRLAKKRDLAEGEGQVLPQDLVAPRGTLFKRIIEPAKNLLKQQMWLKGRTQQASECTSEDDTQGLASGSLETSAASRLSPVTDLPAELFVPIDEVAIRQEPIISLEPPRDVSRSDPFERLMVQLDKPVGRHMKQTEQHVRVRIGQVVYMPMQLGWALYYAILARFDMFCYFLMILDHTVSGNILTMPLPIFVFVWGLLAKPRPSPLFWITVITYVQLIVIIKFVFQSPLISYEKDNGSPLWPPHLFGVEKSSNFTRKTAMDLILLLALCFNRALLRLHGIWKAPKKKSPDEPDGNGSETGHMISADGARVSRPTSTTTDLVQEGDETAVHSPTVSERKKDKDEPTSVWGRVIKRFKHFYKNALDPSKGGGRHDLYTLMFLFDVITFFITIFGWSSFAEHTTAESADVTAYISQNYIPKTFLAMMVVSFLLLVVDRVIYLRKMIRGKFIFQVLLLILVHIWMFFVLPDISKRRFSDNSVAQLWYFIKCIYFAVSAMQISTGYPTRILGHFLTKSAHIVTAVLFLVVQAIPFLLELRELLDWACTETVLSIMYWFKVQDIWASVFVIKSFRDFEKKSKRKIGTPVKVAIKFLVGGLGVAAIIIILWLPLVLMSFLNSTSVANAPFAVSVFLQIGGYQPLFQFTAEQQFLKQLTSSEFGKLKESMTEPGATAFLSKYTAADVVQVSIPGQSSALWSISPPSRDLLKQALSGSSDIDMRFQWSISRKPGSGLTAESVSDVNTTSLLVDSPLRNGLFDVMNSSIISVRVPKLYPTFIQAPANGRALPVEVLNGSRPVEVNLVLKQRDDREEIEWWSLEQVTPHVVDPALASSSTLEMLIFSDRVASPQFSFLAGQGVIGLYVSLVLVVGQFLRLMFKNISHRIMFEDMPNPDNVHALCKNIFLVRESKKHELEERLVGQLFLTYRSPETLIKLTRMK